MITPIQKECQGCTPLFGKDFESFEVGNPEVYWIKMEHSGPSDIFPFKSQIGVTNVIMILWINEFCTESIFSFIFPSHLEAY